MSLPSESEVYSQLMEHLRKAQEASATLAHLVRDNDKLRAQGWLGISEIFKLLQKNVTKLAMRKLN